LKYVFQIRFHIIISLRATTGGQSTEDGSDANVDSPSETEADDVQTSSGEDEGDLPATPVDQPLLTNGDLLGEKMMF